MNAQETIPRVLVVAPQPFYEDRGTPISVRYTLEALAEIGLAVDVLTYPVGESIEIPGIRYFRTGNPFGFRSVPVGLSMRKVFLDVLLTFRLHRLLRSESYLCIQAVEEIAFPAAVLGKHHGVPVIYDMQSSLPEQLLLYPVFRSRPLQALLRALERWLLARVDYVMCSSGLEELVRSIDRDLVVREWWFPGVDALDERSSSEALRRELGIPLQSRVVAYTGTFDSYQGLDEFRGAVARVLVDSPDTHFLIVGARDTEELASFEGSIAEAARGNVRVLSRQPREKMRAYLSMADVLVSPRAGGRNAPLKIFEYMAAGKAIVATDVTAHRRVIDEARAVLVKPTAEHLAQGILGLLQDPDRAARLGAAARSYAQQHLGWNQFVERVRSVYEPLCGNPR